MLKIIFTILLLSPLFLFFVLDKTQNISQTFSTPSPTKTPLNKKQEGVENLTLEKDYAYIVCPEDKYAPCSKDKLSIKVNTLSPDAEDKNLTYYYTVSGGRIIGQGANVVWDFSEEKRPGKYTITASVGNDHIIYGKTITKTIDVEECYECGMICECPTISVSGPTKPIKAGDSFIITTKVSGGSQESVKYKWKITDRQIISEQNAAQIIVKTDPNKKDFILTATVEISGLCENCPTVDSETFTIK